MFERLGSDEFDEHRVLEFDGCTSRPDAVRLPLIIDAKGAQLARRLRAGSRP